MPYGLYMGDPRDPAAQQQMMMMQWLMNRGGQGGGGRGGVGGGVADIGNALLMAYMMKQMQQPGPATQAPNLPGAPAADSLASSNPNLAWNPNSPVGTETMGPTTTNTGSGIGNWLTSQFSNFGGAPLNGALPPTGQFPASMANPNYGAPQPGWQSAATQPVTSTPLPPIPPPGGVLGAVPGAGGAAYPGVLPNFNDPVWQTAFNPGPG